MSTPHVLRHSTRDAWFVVLSAGHAALLLTLPSVPLIALGLWWNANTISHNFIHLPFFRDRRLNRLFSICLSALLGVPQSLWRERHLRHHADGYGATAATRAARSRAGRLLTRDLFVDTSVVAALWLLLAYVSPVFLVTVYLPGIALGLAICQLQGYFEHVSGEATSHYGRLYNALFFNDGLHAEHHRRPGVHWTRLPVEIRPGARASRWPPVLRWLDVRLLDRLETLVVRFPALQRFVIVAHRRAFRTLLPALAASRSATVIGGGLFPRTAIILRELIPGMAITMVDARAEHLEIARRFLDPSITSVCGLYRPDDRATSDLVVIPLAFVGSRSRAYETPPARQVVVHDWIWNRRGQSVVVSWLLLKRLNLVIRDDRESLVSDATAPETRR